MKIYEIGTGYTPIPAQMGAATEIVVEELTRSLIENGEDASIIDIRARDRAPLDLPLSEVRVPALFTKTDISLGLMHKLKRVIYSVCLARHLTRLLKASTEPVVLHFHNQYNLFFALKLIPKKRLQKATVAYTVHSYVWGAEWDAIRDVVKKKYFQEIACVRHADLVLVLNDITADHFVHRLGVMPERIHKVLNGVNIHRYAPLPADTVDAFKREQGLDGKRVIFQVGSVCDRKNQLGSVKMLTAYLKTHPDVIYRYAGGVIDAAYQQTILNYAREQGIADQVYYVGELVPGEQLNAHYNAADCCVFTSTRESFGLVIIEAVSAGTPVVLGSNLMFDLDGGYAMYHTADEFVTAVDAALHAGKVERDAISRVLDTYSWGAVARSHAVCFKTEIGE